MESIKQLVQAKTLAKLLKVSPNWVTVNKDKLSCVLIDGRIFFPVNKSKAIFPTLYKRNKNLFKHPKKFWNIVMERDEADALLEVKAKHSGLNMAEFIRSALRHTYLNGKK